MVFWGGRKPDPVVYRASALVPQSENNLVLNVDGKAAEQGTSVRRHSSQRLENELERNRLALLDAKQRLVERERIRIAVAP